MTIVCSWGPRQRARACWKEANLRASDARSGRGYGCPVVAQLQVRGGYVPLATPFDERGGLDLAALERLADDVLAAGAAGVVALATTGEPTSLDDGERDTVVAVCSRVCADRGAALIVGAGTNDTRTPIARHEALGDVVAVNASLA